MNLTNKLRVEIADNIIRAITPVGIFGTLLCFIGIILFGGQQYHRMIPLMFILILIIASWILAEKGKPLTGIIFIIACICFSIISGMIVSGGIHSLSFTGTLVAVTAVTVLYGTRGGLIFLISAVMLGILFSFLLRQGILYRVNEPTTPYLILYYTFLLVIQIVLILVPVRLMSRAIDEREHSERDLQSLVNKHTDILYRFDLDGKVSSVNEAVRKYGYNPDDLIGRSYKEFVHPDDWPAVYRCYLEGKSYSGVTQDVEVRLCRQNPESNDPAGQAENRTWVPFHISCEGFYSEDTLSSGTFVGMQGVARDISKIRHYEHQVYRLAAIIEQAAEDVIITDLDGVIQYVNPKFVEVTGYSSEEVVGKTPRILKSDKQPKAFYGELWQTIKKGKIWKGRIWNKIKDGSLILQDVTITPIFETKGSITGYASVRRDITEQNRVQEQMQQTQKMEAIGTLAGGIAHDFNNILAGMIGYTELALNSLTKDDVINDMLEQVLEAGGRAADLVKQILSFSRSQKGEVKPVSPSSIAREVLKLMRASLPSTIEIRQSINSNNYISADATKIHQIFMNLCTNAAYAMREKGGILEVSMEEEHIKRNNMAMFRVIPGKYLNLKITDTGPGIPPDIIKKIFEPYFTTKGPGEGTGLGLSVVHGIVQEYGGNIAVESEVGTGTTFSVLLPLIEMKAPSISKREQPLPGGNENILLVDDEKAVADLIAMMLKRMGYRVTERTSSIEALEAFRNNPEKYDLVITDMTMPNMTGKELTIKIKGIRSDVPVILCTGFSDLIDESRAKDSGVSAFIMKPVVFRYLANTVREVLDKK